MSACPSATYKTHEEAVALRRGLRRKWGLNITIQQCDICDQYHLKGDATRLRVPPKCIKVIRLVTLGYTQREITKITGIPTQTINYYIRELKAPFGALSLPHLVAILISLGIIDPREFVPPLTERNHSARRNTDDRKRRAVQRDRAPGVLQELAAG